MSNPEAERHAQRERWLVSAICGTCLNSSTGRSILSGAVGVGTLSSGPVTKCILCGFPFADQVEANPG